jgi:hypothetical protein
MADIRNIIVLPAAFPGTITSDPWNLKTELTFGFLPLKRIYKYMLSSLRFRIDLFRLDFP